jgi:hypothetical protein
MQRAAQIKFKLSVAGALHLRQPKGPKLEQVNNSLRRRCRWQRSLPGPPDRGETQHPDPQDIGGFETDLDSRVFGGDGEGGLLKRQATARENSVAEDAPAR